MLTKVSYNAYASSAGGIKKQNQSQDVNFGMFGSRKSKTAIELKEFARTFVPRHIYQRNAAFLNDSSKEGAKLEAFVDFLNACALLPEAKGQSLLSEVLCKLSLGQRKPTPEKLEVRIKALNDIVAFYKQHQQLTAGEIFDGATKEIPLVRLQELLTDMHRMEDKAF